MPLLCSKYCIMYLYFCTDFFKNYIIAPPNNKLVHCNLLKVLYYVSLFLHSIFFKKLHSNSS
jgi:hypothetical protein